MIARLAASIALVATASVLPALLPAQTSRWATADDSLGRAFTALEREWAAVSCSHGLVEEALLAGDYLGTEPDGTRSTKAQTIAGTKAAKTTARRWQIIAAQDNVIACEDKR
jgi:hypothetical protein